MSEGFRSFAELLSEGSIRDSGPASEGVQDYDAVAPSPEAAEHECRCNCTADAVRDAKLFRARVCEAVEDSAADLLSDIAADVLARELQLQPVDLRAIVDRVLGRFCAEEPLAVRVASSEGIVDLPVPVVHDDVLHEGDAIVEFLSGSVDARLGSRLSRVLDALA